MVDVVAERLARWHLAQTTGGALARGGVEAGADHYPAMVALHAAFLAAVPLEVALLARPWIAPLGIAMLALVACAMALRYWVIAALGERWTTRVVVRAGRSVGGLGTVPVPAAPELRRGGRVEIVAAAAGSHAPG